MKLYGSDFSPYARKARVLIIEKNIDCPYVVDDPWAGDSAIPVMNPLGKVPVLELAPGNYLYESPLVVHYLDHLDGKPLPKNFKFEQKPDGGWRLENSGTGETVEGFLSP